MYSKSEKMAGQAVMAGAKKLDVLDVCPQLILQDRTKRFYDGYITVCVSSMNKKAWLLSAYYTLQTCAFEVFVYIWILTFFKLFCRRGVSEYPFKFLRTTQ